ncbi:MAG: GspH/FimT family pseudopilin [Gammaproteobacteria bacterium]
MKQIQNAGFTIIELMLTIAIGAVLLAVAVPSYTNMVMNNCLTTKTNAIVGAMQLARSTAITVRDNVSVGAITCRMDENNDGSADGSCDSSDDYGDGIVVYRDIDDDGFADSAVEDTNDNGVLDVGEDLNGNGILDNELIKVVRFGCAATIDETTDSGAGGSDATANSTQITYNMKGSISVLGTFNVCDSRDSSEYRGRQVSLSRTGRPATDSDFTCP